MRLCRYVWHFDLYEVERRRRMEPVDVHPACRDNRSAGGDEHHDDEHVERLLRPHQPGHQRRDARETPAP
eukprot:gene2922-biopygen9977